MEPVEFSPVDFGPRKKFRENKPSLSNKLQDSLKKAEKNAKSLLSEESKNQSRQHQAIPKKDDLRGITPVTSQEDSTKEIKDYHTAWGVTKRFSPPEDKRRNTDKPPAKTLKMQSTVAINENQEPQEAAIEVDSTLNQIDENGWTPLTKAIALGDLDRVEQLVTLGANLNHVDEKGWTPLTKAVDLGNRKMVELLAKLGADLNQISGKGWSPLMKAVTLGNLKMVELLANLGADIDKSDRKKWTPLTKAISVGDLKMVELLANLGVNLNLVNERGSTPWTMAFVEENSEMMQLLERLGADPSLELLERKFLAHVWGIGGKHKYTNKDGVKEISYEGFDARYTMKMLAEYADAFFDEGLCREFSISKETRDQLCSALKNGIAPNSTQTSLDILDRAKRGEPVFFTIRGATNSPRGHAISFVLFKEQLAICNRGTGKGLNAVEFYSLPYQEMTEDIIDKLKAAYSTVNSVNEMLSGLNLHKMGGYQHKDQKMGNCTWASPKTAFGVLCHHYFGKEKGREVYKKFTAFTREKSLEHYKTSPYQDKSFTQLIETKKEVKSSRKSL